jgi:hypothetical protein
LRARGIGQRVAEQDFAHVAQCGVWRCRIAQIAGRHVVQCSFDTIEARQRIAERACKARDRRRAAHRGQQKIDGRIVALRDDRFAKGGDTHGLAHMFFRDRRIKNEIRFGI